ncbi:Protein CBG18296 [Caenorhabditis briggsae]|uniref:Large ribosomal subunit protein P2 n=2 Tax=Caenorhabditis briggsae TaxID=6238 RepID=A0AAE9EKB0_CAEBR|nr:Protein CBG18296 [Caenorhabditis briggsae]ULU00043.1 hypothetical protein L3Y34_000942 [Caenorhabditis briggsae]UMM22728.1 hypothetical protein L5515_003799 [Caenorhabditis briggsae]CAP35773.1 Protein CBG18296 [Caenorhabditis briggsae]
MRYISAYLLAVLGGNANPQADDIKNILSAVGVDANAESVNLVVSGFKGKNIEELIAAGSAKLATISGGVGAASSAAPAVGGAAPAADSKPAKKEEPKEESDDDMGFGLFD